MIRRIFFILLIFIFTTGFFKSKLEKCADKKVGIDDIIYPFTTVQVPKTKDEIRKDSLKLKKVKEKYKEDKAKGLNPIKFLYDMEVRNLEYKYKSVKISGQVSNSQGMYPIIYFLSKKLFLLLNK